MTRKNPYENSGVRTEVEATADLSESSSVLVEESSGDTSEHGKQVEDEYKG